MKLKSILVAGTLATATLVGVGSAQADEYFTGQICSDTDGDGRWEGYTVDTVEEADANYSPWHTFPGGSVGCEAFDTYVPPTPNPVVHCVSDEAEQDAQPVLPCVWDARHMGNGTGNSFVVRPLSVRYVSHHRAHVLAYP